MLIVGGTKDYYDSAMGLGIDKTVVYNRVQSFAPPVNKITQQDLYGIINSIPIPHSNSYPHYWISAAVLLVCGEAVPIIQIEGFDCKKHTFYSAAKTIDFMISKNINFNKYFYYFSKHHCISSIKGIQNFFKDQSFSVLTKLHYIHKCPVILCRNNKKEESIQLNPKLKDLSYQTQKDPYTVFQSIYMFISGVLGTPMKEPRPISDEIKAANAGHDGKYSFKNLPGKKRGRNK